MKKTAILILVASYSFVIGQKNNDINNVSLTDSTAQNKHQKKIYNEIGVNTTYLIKQMFSSNGGFEVQPYQLTYKLIKNKAAIRSGIGVNWSNYRADDITFSSTNYYGPDTEFPSYSKSYNIYGRLGWEYRFRVSRKLLAYTGIDIVAQVSKADSQMDDLTNNLPSSYFYNSRIIHSNSNTYGTGAVFGLQFYATSRFSIYAELPVYFLCTYQKTEQYQYTDYLATGNTFESSFTDSYKNTQSKNINITLPATIYFAIKF